MKGKTSFSIYFVGSFSSSFQQPYFLLLSTEMLNNLLNGFHHDHETPTIVLPCKVNYTRGWHDSWSCKDGLTKFCKTRFITCLCWSTICQITFNKDAIWMLIELFGDELDARSITFHSMIEIETGQTRFCFWSQNLQDGKFISRSHG